MNLPRVSINAPLILLFCGAAIAVFAADRFMVPGLLRSYFILDTGPKDVSTYAKLVTYTLGHESWSHMINNVTYILLLGPALEARHGFRPLLFMMAITAVISGLASIWFFGAGLLGASGIVCLMILLTSFANSSAGTIPLTFLLIAPLFIANEAVSAMYKNNVSQFAHLMGGAMGAIFGYWRR